jgi:hypothetical protein
MIVTIDNIVSYLGRHIGANKVPLVYVIHDNVIVLLEANDLETNPDTK